MTHMPRNEAAAPGHVCPGIRIHAIDIVQPPGIGISPIADMDVHQTVVIAVLAAKSSAETPKKARWEARSEAMGREIFRPAGLGLDGLWGMYQWLDRAPKGRNETGIWWRHHDMYDKD